MIRTIEKHHNAVIQKVYDAKGKLLHYQTGIIGDAASITTSPTLAEARKALGIEIQHPVVKHKPKMENPQNQKGYNAHRR